MKNEIIALLNDAKLCKKLISSIKEQWNYAGTIYENPDEDMQKDIEKKPESKWEEAWWRAENFSEFEKINNCLDRYVISKLSKPYLVTHSELCQSFWDIAKPDENSFLKYEKLSSEECMILIMLFRTYVINKILSFRTGDQFPVGLMVSQETLDYEGVFWKNNDIALTLSRGVELRGHNPGGKRLHYLLASIEGNISASALKLLEAEIHPIVISAFRSADYLQSLRNGAIKRVDVDMPLFCENNILFLPWLQNLKELDYSKTIIQQYLDNYFMYTSNKKDSLEKRVGNAICLIVESDKQTNNAIGLALSVAAMEALLGEKGEGISGKLADNLAVLLEPDLDQRNNASVFVKQLYDSRSRALHGESIETEALDRLNARHLAAAALNSVISRKEFVTRLGFSSENPEDLLKELRQKRFKCGQPDGIDETNINLLWRKHS